MLPHKFKLTILWIGIKDIMPDVHIFQSERCKIGETVLFSTKPETVMPLP